MSTLPTNLFQYYQSKGTALPSLSERATAYQSAGLGKASEYTGTADQNTALLGSLTNAPPPVTTPSKTTSTSPVKSISSGLSADDGGSAASSSNPVRSAISSGQSTPEKANGSSNFASFAASVTPAGGPPAAPDYASTYAAQRASLGIDTVEDNITTLQQQAATLAAQLPAFEATAEEGATSGKVFNARESEEQRNIQSQLDIVNGQISIAQTTLQNKNDFLTSYMDWTEKDYTAANTEYENTLSDNMSLVSAFNTQQDKTQASAQANLQTINTLLSNSGKTYSDLSPTQQTQINQLELAAGLPPGTFATFAASKPKADVLGMVNGKDGYTSVISRDPSTGAITASKIYTGVSTATPTATDSKDDFYSFINQQISSGGKTANGSPIVDSSGYITPDGLKAMIAAGATAGLSKDDILAEYSDQLYLPLDANGNVEQSQASAYGLSPVDVKKITGTATIDPDQQSGGSGFWSSLFGGGQ